MAFPRQDQWLEPVGEEEPCGPDLGFDTRYLELEQIFRGPQRGPFEAGLPDPSGQDWRHVVDRCHELIAESRDLRFLTLLAHAEVELRGADGLFDVLELARSWLERFGSSLHPGGESEPDGSFLSPRARALASLASSHGPFRTQPGLPGRVRGWKTRVEHRDLGVTEEAVARACAAIDKVAQAIVRIDDVAPDLSQLVEALRAPTPPQPSEPDPSGGGAEPEPRPAPVRLTAPRAIQTPEEAQRAIEAVCAWFEFAEPSSPIPTLLRRAMRLQGARFLDVLRELTPDEIELLRRDGSGADRGGDA